MRAVAPQDSPSDAPLTDTTLTGATLTVVPETDAPVKRKPLDGKAYYSIGHLPGSRLGTGDHHVPEAQARLVTEQTRDRHDLVIVQEKLDGTCVAVAKLAGEIVALIRKGYLARTSPREMHHLFADWVDDNAARFDDMLDDGERVVGEWLAQAHGTRYDLTRREPFVLLDGFDRQNRRLAFMELQRRNLDGPHLTTAHVISTGAIPHLTAYALANQQQPDGSYGRHGALEPVEGVVYRLERRGVVEFLAKYVAADKVDGKYLPEISGAALWNWRP